MTLPAEERTVVMADRMRDGGEPTEKKLEQRGRRDGDAEVDVSELVDAPAAGVLDDELVDPPEPSEPG
jgi:predicted Rdx family selenoprotein